MSHLLKTVVGAVVLAWVLSGCAVQPGGPAQRGESFPDGRHGLVTPYTVTLRYFAPGEARNIIDVMAGEFPGYRSHTLMSSDAAMRRYAYVTSAPAHKVEEWLTILLGRMNLNPDTDVHMVIEGAEITVEKLSAAPRFSGRNVRFGPAADATPDASWQPPSYEICSAHVIRGGSWNDWKSVLRAGFRNYDNLTMGFSFRGDEIGFRVARSLTR